jgi:hypothetical protein
MHGGSEQGIQAVEFLSRVIWQEISRHQFVFNAVNVIILLAIEIVENPSIVPDIEIRNEKLNAVFHIIGHDPIN